MVAVFVFFCTQVPLDDWAQRLIRLEIPVLVRPLKSSKAELSMLRTWKLSLQALVENSTCTRTSTVFDQGLQVTRMTRSNFIESQLGFQGLQPGLTCANGAWGMGVGGSRISRGLKLGSNKYGT